MSVSRRGFLTGLTAGGASLVAARATAGSGIHHFPGYSGRYGLLHDTTLCVGCRSCELACKQVNDIATIEHPRGDVHAFDEARRVTPTSLTVVNRYQPAADSPPVFRKHQCMHCNEPCCASVCLVRAFTKTPEGPVLYNPDLCMGCRYCVAACPYNALSYEYDEPLTPRVMRCTMCYDRITAPGGPKLPGCAEACPNGAITFGRRDELIALARDRFAKHPGRYLHHVFGEHELGGTSWLVLAGVPFAALGLHEGLNHTPLPELGTSFLSVVPLVITIYPGLLAGFYSFSKRKEKLAQEHTATAVAAERTRAQQELKEKMDAAAKKAATDKERAVEAAIKKALAEAAKAKATP
jgi:Fe-S-cluster-containing dehydrogenase component